MVARKKNVSIRLSVEDEQTVRRALEQLGATGNRALDRIEKASRPASKGLQTVNAAAQEGQQVIQGYANRLGPLGSILQKVGKGGLAAAAAVAAVGAAGIGLKRLADQAADAGDQFQKMSLRTGFSTEVLSQLAFAAELSGANIESVESSLVRLQRRMVASIGATNEQSKAFDFLGVAVADAQGRARDAEAVFFDIADAVARLGESTETTNAITRVLGRSAAALIPLMKQGAAGIRELMALTPDVITQAQADQAAAYNDQLLILDRRFKAMGQTLGFAAIPAFNAFSEALDEALADPETQKGLETTAKLVGDILGVLVKLPAAIENIASANWIPEEVIEFNAEIERMVKSVRQGRMPDGDLPPAVFNLAERGAFDPSKIRPFVAPGTAARTTAVDPLAGFLAPLDTQALGELKRSFFDPLGEVDAGLFRRDFFDPLSATLRQMQQRAGSPVQAATLGARAAGVGPLPGGEQATSPLGFTVPGGLSSGPLVALDALAKGTDEVGIAAQEAAFVFHELAQITAGQALPELQGFISAAARLGAGDVLGGGLQLLASTIQAFEAGRSPAEDYARAIRKITESIQQGLVSAAASGTGFSQEITTLQRQLVDPFFDMLAVIQAEGERVPSDSPFAPLRNGILGDLQRLSQELAQGGSLAFSAVSQAGFASVGEFEQALKLAFGPDATLATIAPRIFDVRDAFDGLNSTLDETGRLTQEARFGLEAQRLRAEAASRFTGDTRTDAGIFAELMADLDAFARLAQFGGGGTSGASGGDTGGTGGTGGGEIPDGAARPVVAPTTITDAQQVIDLADNLTRIVVAWEDVVFIDAKYGTGTHRPHTWGDVVSTARLDEMPRVPVDWADVVELGDPVAVEPSDILDLPTTGEWADFYSDTLHPRIAGGAGGGKIADILDQHLINIRAHDLDLVPSDFIQMPSVDRWQSFYSANLHQRIAGGQGIGKVGEILNQHLANIHAHDLDLQPGDFIDLPTLARWQSFYSANLHERIAGGTGIGKIGEILNQHRANVLAHDLDFIPSDFVELPTLERWKSFYSANLHERIAGGHGIGKIGEILNQHRINIHAHDLDLQPGDFIDLPTLARWGSFYSANLHQRIAGGEGSGKIGDILEQHHTNVTAHRWAFAPEDFIELPTQGGGGWAGFYSSQLLTRIAGGAGIGQVGAVLEQHHANVVAHRWNFTPGDFISIPTQRDFFFLYADLPQRMNDALELVLGAVDMGVALGDFFDISPDLDLTGDLIIVPGGIENQIRGLAAISKNYIGMNLGDFVNVGSHLNVSFTDSNLQIDDLINFEFDISTATAILSTLGEATEFALNGLRSNPSARANLDIDDLINITGGSFAAQLQNMVQAAVDQAMAPTLATRGV